MITSTMKGKVRTTARWCGGSSERPIGALSYGAISDWRRPRNRARTQSKNQRVGWLLTVASRGPKR